MTVLVLALLASLLINGVFWLSLCAAFRAHNETCDLLEAALDLNSDVLKKWTEATDALDRAVDRVAETSRSLRVH